MAIHYGSFALKNIWPSLASYSSVIEIRKKQCFKLKLKAESKKDNIIIQKLSLVSLLDSIYEKLEMATAKQPQLILSDKSMSVLLCHFSPIMLIMLKQSPVSS